MMGPPRTNRTAFLAARVLIAAGFLLSAAACEEASAPQGQTSDLEVRAYVDADGSGTFGAGDVPIAGATITARAAGEAVTATTGADGIARFEGLQPGAYVLSISGVDVPGAVLSGAATPVAVAPFSGGQISREFRYAFFPGIVAGVVFRDDDESGDFDPEFDTPAPGMTVHLYRGSSAAGEPLATTVTDVAGAFSFDNLRPGQYLLELEPFETIEIVGGATRTVTVGAAESIEIEVLFTGSLVIPIATARERLGQSVTIEGVVVYQEPWDSRIYFLQDETGGISTFHAGAPNLEVGDHVRVTGTASSFRGEVQLSPVLELTILGHVGEPAPMTVTAAEINAGLYQGMFVSVPDARVESVEVINQFGTHVITAIDAAGDAFSVYADNRSGIAAGAWQVASRYDFRGVLGTDNRDARPHRLELRSPDDADLAGDAITVAEARARPTGETVTIQAIVTVPQGPFGSGSIYVQDGTAGIMVFGVPTALAAEVGDIVRLTGRIGQFGGEVQLERFSSTELIIASKEGETDPPEPRLVTGAEVLARTYEGSLARVEGLVVQSAPAGSNSHNVSMEAPDGSTFQVRVSSNAGVGIAPDFWEVGAAYDVVGVLGSFNGTPQVKVRSPDDVVKQ